MIYQFEDHSVQLEATSHVLLLQFRSFQGSQVGKSSKLVNRILPGEKKKVAMVCPKQTILGERIQGILKQCSVSTVFVPSFTMPSPCLASLKSDDW